MDGDMHARLKAVIVALLCAAILASALPARLARAGPTPGVVDVWGANNSGQLGTGTMVYSNIPLLALGMTEVVAIAAGSYHSLALTSDGTVWAWGANDQRQLGAATGRCRAWKGTYPCSLIPMRVPNLNGIVAIAAGGRTSLALRWDGTVWQWGTNANGQLGFPTPLTSQHTWSPQPSPARVPRLAHIVAIKTTGISSLALTQDGTVWQWGLIAGGHAATGPGPSLVPGLRDVVAVAPGGTYSLALKKDGTVWGWGWSADGGMGIGPQRGRKYPLPRQIRALTEITALAAGGGHNLALRKDGTVWAWGSNSDCLVGIGRCSTGTAITSTLLPVQVPRLAQVSAIAAGVNHDAALTRDGRVWVWGDNSAGQLGIGTSYGVIGTPLLAHLSTAVAIAVGFNHTLALSAPRP